MIDSYSFNMSRMYGMAQQWSFVKYPLIIAMWVVLAVSLSVISVSIYQQQNASSDVNNNASKNELVFPITDHHAPIPTNIIPY